MHYTFFYIFLIFVTASCCAASEWDFKKVISEASEMTDAEDSDVRSWEYCLSRLPQPESAEFISHADRVSADTGVPAQLIMAVAHVENNWVQIYPSIDKGYGIMHLVENSFCNTLKEASELTGIPAEVLKNDWKMNVSASAALIASYVSPGSDLSSWKTWVEPLKRFSGLSSEDLRSMQAETYFTAARDGFSNFNVLNQKVRMIPERSINLSELFTEKALQRTDVEFPGAVAKFTVHNHKKGRLHKADTWINHYIATGTYAGAISWFNMSESRVAAHFVIRSKDGEITQVVRSEDTGWHTTNVKAPKGGWNNARSLGIEFEATIANPSLWNSEAMLKNAAELTAFFCRKYDIPFVYGCPGINKHKNMPQCSTDCPGNDCPWDKLWALTTGGIPMNPVPVLPSQDLILTGKVNKSGTSLRSGPGTKYEVIATLSSGTELQILGENKEWLRVKTIKTGKSGFIQYTLVSLSSAEL